VVAEEKIERTADLDEARAMERLRRYIESPPENSRIFIITPGMAAEILRDYNINNRSKKPGRIARYARHMAEDTWALTGDTIKFSIDGRLRDGQNRLTACVRAGVPFRTHIVFGIAKDAFDRMDQGKNRDGGDVLTTAGVGYAHLTAAAVRWVHLIETGRAKQRDTIEPSEILKLLRDKYDDIGQYVQQARSIYSTTGQPASLVMAMLYLFSKANPIRAAEFAAAWESGKWAGKYQAIQFMQKRTSELQSASSGRVHDVIRAALIINAWNLFLSGRKGRQSEVKWDKADAFPEIGG
jgi:hypothetical protein